jgi:hypothetical protein
VAKGVLIQTTVPPEIAAALKKAAKAEDRPVANFLRQLLARTLAERAA